MAWGERGAGMKAHRAWSYAPYCPPFIDRGDIYICRIAPGKNDILVAWLDAGAEEYCVYCGRRGGDLALVGKTGRTEFRILDLEDGCEYEVLVTAGEKKSLKRLVKCAETFGTVINYLHPEDMAYAFSGRYLCSPSLVRLPSGALLASMDLFKENHPQNLTLIFRSDDDGATWQYQSELFPCFWGKMFLHKGALYVLACATEYGDLLIGRSDDEGKTFTEPTVLLRGANGKNGTAGVHKNPQPVLSFGGRLWNTLEWGAWGSGYHAAMVMSVPEDADLLDADAWSFSEPVKYDPTWPGVPAGPSNGNIEGALTVIDGKLYNIMRYDMTAMTPNSGLVLAYEVNTEEPEAPLRFCRTVALPGNHTKFMIKRHKETGRYYTIISRIYDERPRTRNLLSLMVSEDGWHWSLVKDIMDLRHLSAEDVGLQYVDFEIEGEEIIFLCRTAMNGAHNYHDSNYSIFHRISLE